VNVFVESNFVLEIALEQQEQAACERLLELAADGSIRLFVPAYSFVEPHETFTRRHRDRETLRSHITNELAQIARSASLAERARASQEVVALMAESVEYESRRLQEAKERIWLVATILSIDADVVQRAPDCQANFDLSPQDAVVYASIRGYLTTDHDDTSCFVSRNPKDFDDPDLRRELTDLNCRYFSSFSNAVQFIEHAVGRSA
jgi:predicted nucleic acid-binding protein